MDFKDILNKGKELINKGATAAKDAALEKKQAIQDFDILKTRSDHIGPMKPYEVHNNDPQKGREQQILNVCLSLNVENSKLINSLLPLDETIVDAKTAKEAKTEISYNFAVTDKRVWIVNQREYMTYEFSDIKNCGIVNRGMMTQGIKFDDKAFYVDGTETDVKKFCDILSSPDARMAAITRATSYLCGITPTRQMINMYMKGITIGPNNQVVLHNNTENKLINLQDISYMQVLINDNVAYIKSKSPSDSFVSSPLEARKISVKFALNMDEYVIDILSPSLMNTVYKREDSVYIENYNFAKMIVDTLADMIQKIV